MENETKTGALFGINRVITFLSIIGCIVIFFFLAANSRSASALNWYFSIGLLLLYFYLILKNLADGLSGFQKDASEINYPAGIASFLLFLMLLLGGSILYLFLVNREAAGTAAVLTFFAAIMSMLLPSLALGAFVHFVSPALLIPGLKSDSYSAAKYNILFYPLLLAYLGFGLVNGISAFNNQFNFTDNDKFKIAKLNTGFQPYLLKIGEDIQPKTRQMLEKDDLNIPFYYTVNEFPFENYKDAANFSRSLSLKNTAPAFESYEDAERFSRAFNARVPNFREAYNIAYYNFDVFGDKYYWISDKDENGRPLVLHFKNMAYTVEHLPGYDEYDNYTLNGSKTESLTQERSSDNVNDTGYSNIASFSSNENHLSKAGGSNGAVSADDIDRTDVSAAGYSNLANISSTSNTPGASNSSNDVNPADNPNSAFSNAGSSNGKSEKPAKKIKPVLHALIPGDGTSFGFGGISGGQKYAYKIDPIDLGIYSEKPASGNGGNIRSFHEVNNYKDLDDILKGAQPDGNYYKLRARTSKLIEGSEPSNVSNISDYFLNPENAKKAAASSSNPYTGYSNIRNLSEYYNSPASSEIERGKKLVHFNVRYLSADEMTKLIAQGYDYNLMAQIVPQNIPEEVQINEEIKLNVKKNIENKEPVNISYCDFPSYNYVNFTMNQERQVWQQSFCSPSFVLLNPDPGYVPVANRITYCRKMGGRLPNVPELSAIIKFTGKAPGKFWTNTAVVDKRTPVKVPVTALFGAGTVTIECAECEMSAYAYCVRAANPVSSVAANFKSRYQGYNGGGIVHTNCPECYYYEVPDAVVKQ